MGKLGPRVPECRDLGKLDPRSGTAGVVAAGDAMGGGRWSKSSQVVGIFYLSFDLQQLSNI